MQIAIQTNAEPADLPTCRLPVCLSAHIELSQVQRLHFEYICERAESETRCAFHSDNLLTFFFFCDAKHRPGGDGKGRCAEANRLNV